MSGRQLADFGTSTSAGRGQPEQRSHLIEAETELAGAANERQSPDLIQAVAAISPAAAGRG